MIEVSNLSKLFRIHHEKRDTIFGSIKNIIQPLRYEELWALRDISFKVNKGEFIGVIGENGSGKTTLLKLIANVLSPTKGYVKTFGKVTPFLELGLGFHDDLTGRENVYLYSRIMGLSKEEIDERIDNIIRFSGLRRFIDAKLNTYSSGMKVRLAFSTAVQTDSDIILVDEVLAVGDLNFQQKCYSVFRRFKKNQKTVLYVSHDMNSIKRFCDKAILLKKGRQVMFDYPECVINEYISSVTRKNKLIKARNVEFRFKDNSPDFERIKNLKKIINVKWGTKEIEIIKVELFNKNNKKNVTFVSGDPLRIRIHYKKNKNIKKPIFGIGIFYEDGKYCFGTNTQIEDYKINELKQQGYIDVYIKKLAMWEGDFYLSVSVHNNKQYHYDWHNKRYKFKIINFNNYNQGLLNLDCEWKLPE